MNRSDVLDVVREVNPLPAPDPLVDPSVRARTLEHVLTCTDQPAADRSRRRRWRLPLLGILAPLMVAGVAFAATQILSGAPYRPPWGHRTAQSDMGVAISSTVRLLPLRVADADGGPPWGMRVMRTTRGDECMQIGRVVRGQLGVLGQDGIFRDDHRFHPLPASAFADFDCALVGTGGYAVIGNWDTVHASGLDLVGTCSYPGGPPPTCPRGDLRFIAYGLLGPDARAITFRQNRGTGAITPVGRDGAYLVVHHERTVLAVHGSSGGGAGLAGGGGPGSFPGTLAVVYRDGSTCRTPDPPGAASCVYRRATPSVPVHLRLRPIRVRATLLPLDSMFQDVAPAVLHFIAPITVNSGALDYAIFAHNPGVKIANNAGTLGRDVRRGAKVAWKVYLPRCRRTVRIKLYLGRATPESVSGHGLPIPLVTLAHVTLRLPRRPPPRWCKGP